MSELKLRPPKNRDSSANFEAIRLCWNPGCS